VVTPGYFRTLDIRLVRGRLFTQQDQATAPGVVIVSETAARRLWPGSEAIGQRLRDPLYRADDSPATPAWQTVVGVVEDVRYRGLSDVRLDLYLPAAQAIVRVQQLMIRTTGVPTALPAAIKGVVQQLSAGTGVSAMTPMTEVVARESAPWRFLMRVFGAFALVAGLLATSGLWLVVTLVATSRRRELAIRAALGAGRAQLRDVLLRDGCWLVLGGLTAGLVGAFVLGQAVAPVLVGVAPHDAVATVASLVVVGVTGLTAIWIPARRAAGIDPIEALKRD
jgi:hypothetical protein